MDDAGNLQRLADFLEGPRERLDVELKQWLDLSDANVRGKVARHLMALANHGGGWLQFGFIENDDGRFEHETAQGCPDTTQYFDRCNQRRGSAVRAAELSVRDLLAGV